MVRPPISENICIRCKGARLLCGKNACPILMKYSILKSTVPEHLKTLQKGQPIFGASPPAVFVGHVGYPKVNIGPLLPIGDYATQKDTHMLDAPEEWFGKPLEQIVEYRSGMIRSNFSMYVKYNEGIDDTMQRLNREHRKMLDSTHELTMAANSVDIEAVLSKIRFSMDYDNHSQPQGPSGIAEEIKVIDNVKVPKPVDKVVSDKDLKAADAVFGVLYDADDVTVTSMQRLMSAGLLGEQKNRRLVPTRWAITAVDDIIGKGLAPFLHNLPEIDKYYTFFGEYLDNKFMVLFAPGQWKYEMNECWNASTLWNQPVPGIDTYYSPVPVIVNDFELEYGRKNYAGNVTGAYYAARKEIEEFLFTSHRQASVIVFREVAGGYIVPLGVWVIRETVKKALAEGWKGENVRIHETLKDAVNRLREVFEVPVKYWLAASNLIRYIKTQYKLDRWIK